MTTPTTDVPDDQKDSRPDFGMIGLTVIAVMGLMLGLVALLIANDGGDGSPEVDAGGSGAPVELTEFAIASEPISVGTGGSLEVSNAGSQVHNLAIEGTDLITADLAGGESEALDASSLEAGEYEVFCAIAGHKDAGMVGSLVVEEGGGSTAASAAATEGGHEGPRGRRPRLRGPGPGHDGLDAGVPGRHRGRRQRADASPRSWRTARSGSS